MGGWVIRSSALWLWKAAVSWMKSSDWWRTSAVPLLLMQSRFLTPDERRSMPGVPQKNCTYRNRSFPPHLGWILTVALLAWVFAAWWAPLPLSKVTERQPLSS
jgi:hypothetical protein